MLAEQRTEDRLPPSRITTKLNRSQVMGHRQLSDVWSQLTGRPGIIERATGRSGSSRVGSATHARAAVRRGWSLVRFSAHLEASPAARQFPARVAECQARGGGGRPRPDRQRGRLREVPREACGQDRADPARARRADARRHDRPSDGGEGAGGGRDDADPASARWRAWRARPGRRRSQRGPECRRRGGRPRRPRRRTVARHSYRPVLQGRRRRRNVQPWRRQRDGIDRERSDRSAAAHRRRHDLSERRRIARRRRRHRRAKRDTSGRALQPHGPCRREERSSRWS